MLKALELSGFKSFADKTRFEFPSGITVVVGPNGSGKSNIVDAIKWVLGEQSAKSLRGKDMSDVIFKGSSGANARRPANAATATIVLDNTDNRFGYDADEVLVTRRVYRSGESEYLINGESCRLKDIRELFRGTGVGTDAYSLIEQGKVERLLSTSPKDRRAIFEEAAGISRFKAKKVEAQRRLQRVDGNLIRLADIVEEVGSRYRSVKAQASKAARYKECSDRLQQLRTYAGLKDWRTYTEKITHIKDSSQQATDQENQFTNDVAQFEDQASKIESDLEGISQTLMLHQETAGRIREQIAQTESKVSLNQQRQEDLDLRQSQISDQLDRATQRSDELQTRIKKSEADTQTAEASSQDSAEQLLQIEKRLQVLGDDLNRLRVENQQRRSQQTELADVILQSGRQVSADESQLGSLTESQNKLESIVAELTSQHQSFQQESDTANAEKERLQSEEESRDSELADLRQRHDSLKSELAGRQQRLNELTQQHAGLTQRAEVIEELERSLQGINAGAREILQQSKSATAGPLKEVLGLVADLVSVNVQHAAIVDVALGEMAQYVVVDGQQLVRELADENFKPNGRVGLIQLNQPPTLGTNPNIDLNGAAGVIGRTDRLVQVQPDFTSFIRQLLGGTWVVKTLSDALHLHSTHEHADQVRLVTLDGEIVEADGSIIVGPKSLTTGLVSRRSELRALKRQLIQLDEEIKQCQSQVSDLDQQEDSTTKKIQQQLNENKELASRLADQSTLAHTAEQNGARTLKQLQQSQQEGKTTADSRKQLAQQLDSNRIALNQHELLVSRLVQQISEDEKKSEESENLKSDLVQQTTLAKVKSAKAEQFLDGVQARLAQHHEEFVEHQQSIEQLQQQQQADQQAVLSAKKEIETGSLALHDLNAEKEAVAEHLTSATQQRLEVDSKRRGLVVQLTEKRDALRSTQDIIHQSQIRLEQITMQRDQLAARIQEDYGIEIAELEQQPDDQELEQREQVDTEITELRKTISTIGSVNLDALQELEDLESRYLSMDEQYQDLVQAKETLQRIISRIDTDSRKLFVETVEAIRQNFQKLFRQTFGGGHADIILEEGVDPLDAGVEIIATPPGKPQFNNSLLSGGEKALTAVSLLMAIFQFRPSPFCVLDEVDAPFDEANIGRFIDVLKSFLGWTKFVIVTHSKKTMTAATTLYGVTMQESGVSKRVSVRFEDVSEDGQISDDAILRANDDAA